MLLWTVASMLPYVFYHDDSCGLMIFYVVLAVVYMFVVRLLCVAL